MTELQAADAYCRYLMSRHYENFTVASLLLPSTIRLHLMRLYAYSRTTDDLGDESGGNALARLAAWRAQVEQCVAGGPDPTHPVLLALRHTIDACRLPPQPFLDLIAANVQDQTTSAYATWEDLRAYCQLSAAPVGQLVLRIWGIRHAGADRLSDDVCIGLQLANFAQDVAVDRAKQRTYLIQADLRAGGVPGAVRAMCDRAESLLASGSELEALVPGRLRMQLALYRLGGVAILSAVRRMDYRTDERRPHLSPLTKLSLLPQAFLQRGRSRDYVSTHGAA
ncbi:MAG TPA: squalene/phytoene synthase family protein [Chloroflexota bacterium]